MSDAESAVTWQASLDALADDATCEILERAVVVESCATTQAACMDVCDGRAGILVTTLKQTSGKGRLGRSWIDGSGESVAMTLAVRAEPSERLALWTGIAVCSAARELGLANAAVRWPNDVLADSGRKLAGILIEQHDDLAFIGIGLNVLQRHWPPDLADIAVSLAECGVTTSRIAVIESVIRSLDRTRSRSDSDLVAEFRDVDMLVGTNQTFMVAGGTQITGQVVDIDPLQGLIVDTPSGRKHLPAAFTSLQRA